MIPAGLLAGVVAAVSGWIDWFAIPVYTRAKRVGLLHGAGNVLVLILFGLSWLWRSHEPGYQPTTLALIGSGLAFLLAALTGWLGGELVDRPGVGVDDKCQSEGTAGHP